MHQERENLDILFRRTAPEAVLENIRQYGMFSAGCPLRADAMSYPYQTYEHYLSLNMPEYSPDETQLRFAQLEQTLGKEPAGMLFAALYTYADKVLKLQGGIPVCRQETVLGWNSISKRLGQDLLVTAWMAWEDEKENLVLPKGFVWPAVIGTDDGRLGTIYERGLAENHFHLHGSTQSFALSWTCLMNHPERIGKYFRKGSYFMENLSTGVSRGELDNQMSWRERIEYAAMIRGLLFSRCADILDSGEVWERFRRFDHMPLAAEIKQQAEALRSTFGTKFAQKIYKGLHFDYESGKKCLDYANSSYFYEIDENAANRMLAGERSFLYHCFRLQFASGFTLQESSLFYLYLLIKSQFRSELIQVNGRVGFTNFAQYQDRKNLLFGELKEYLTEAQRLSVGAAMENGHLISLEARIMPRETVSRMRRDVAGLDAMIRLAVGEDGRMPHYVVHFPKKKFSLKEFEKREYLLLPRNWMVREATRKKAKALARYLQNDREGAYRILGIDACSLEIGCRPEVFATEFRYLRKYGRRMGKSCWSSALQEPYKVSKSAGGNIQEYGQLGVTYHVGEDFLDIMDGLRAIDEAIAFLQMEKGDRLGHALALGIDPEAYYRSKRRNIYLTKQDYLDNLVWMLYRSLELNVNIDANHRAKMQEEARRLLMEIYYSSSSFGRDIANRQPMEMLDMYYDSWKLRGDHPDLYRTGVYKEEDSLSSWVYASCMTGKEFPFNYRGNEVIAGLYYMYHFDAEAKKKGLQPECFDTAGWYVELVKGFQEAIRREVAMRGIAVECNPTSNVLIGTFGSYDRHPILNFSRCRLDELSRNTQIQVSINTDDLGVFDTSLENEYALLLCAVCRARHRQGNYNDDAVYEYLDYVRENGIRMSFQKNQKKH